MLLLAASIIPPLYLLWKVYESDRIEKEPPKLLAVIFVLGMISTFFAGILEVIGSNILGSVLPEQMLSSPFGLRIFNFLFYFIVVGGAEELVKFCAMRIPSWRSPAFNYVFDGVVYGATAALGFAALENIMYVLDSGLVTAGVRAWTAIPLHCITGIFMGHYYGIAKAAERWGDRRRRNQLLRRSILIPMLIHGAYDFIATDESPVLSILFFVYIIIVDVFAVRALNQYAGHDVNLE